MMIIRNFTIGRAMLCILFILLFALATRIPIDTDTWWHLRSAEYTLSHGMIYKDPFSHTMIGEAWINHSWGAQIILLGVWSLFGNVGLAFYTSVLAVGGMAFLYRISLGNIYLRAFVLILGSSTASIFWSARPQMMSFFFSAVFIYILYSYKREKKDYLWLLPILMMLWGNLHAGFSIGFIFIGAVIIGEIFNVVFIRDAEHSIGWVGIRKLTVIGAFSVFALMINPYGVAMLRVPFDTVSIGPLRDYIQEWNSPNFQERQTWPFLFTIFILLGAAWGGRRQFDWTDYFLLIGTMFMSFLAGRQIAVFAVVAVPILSYHLHSLLNARGWILIARQNVSLRLARLNIILVSIVGLGALIYIATILNPHTVEKTQSDYLPIKAVAYLNSANPPGPMFNSYNWGGYLMFAAPQYPVFVDGRTDLYRDFLRQWLNTALGNNGWRDTFAEFDIQLVVVEKGSGLDMNLREEAGWKLAYEDDMAVIWQRD